LPVIAPDRTARRLRPGWTLAAVVLALALPALAQAYVGPGAGFAFLGSFFTLLLALGAGVLSLLTWPLRFVLRSLRRRRALARATVRRLVVVGFDGLDPALAERWMAEGHLPNLSRLAKSGSFSRLRTTYPAISPVAWSTFMTGVDPARHNIFDFLNRDLRTYRPALSSSDVRPPSRVLRIGRFALPLSRPTVRGMRRSVAFWTILGRHRIPCQILRVPLTFPPEKFSGALLAAMCIPDLRGTQGSFTYFTTDPKELAPPESSAESQGGCRELVRIDDDGLVRASLAGPDHPVDPARGPLRIPFELHVDRAKKEARLAIGGRSYALKEREYSPWVRLTFRAGLGKRAHGIARFYITRIEPELGVYVTPIQIDPARPALPISHPWYFSTYLAKLLGEFATLGLAEDTWALSEQVIDEEAFLKQTLDHHEERERMLFNALDTSREGVVAVVFDGTDRLQHMFFRTLDPEHPANRGRPIGKYADTIRDMYARCDALVGRVLERLHRDDALLVLSDHGFQSFRRGVNLNSWLRAQGLLTLVEGRDESGDWFEGVDWSRTQAYAFGLGGIYVNQRGREAQGVVEPGEETEALKRRIVAGLSGLRDEARAAVAIVEVFDNCALHPSGPYRDAGPDLIVGYDRGYRASWEGAVGRTAPELFCDNTRAWSGDHCIDPRLVPGVLFSSRRMVGSDPAIGDLAPTILTLFGVTPPEHMTGRALEFAA
jgi:predicted AlkP superfamily phosphohydrolase/phosphomutase